jgi:hypothetical protein
MKRVILLLVLASIFIVNAGPFEIGRFYVITLASGKERKVRIKEVKDDCILVSDLNEQGAIPQEWIFIRNIESFHLWEY